MNDHDDDFDELHGPLDDIVAGLNSNPVPRDLKDNVRARLGSRFELRRKQSLSGRGSVAFVSSAIALTLAAIVLVPTSSETTLDSVTDTSSTGVEIRRLDPEPAPGPSLWSYHVASNHSAEQLDNLLTDHAGAALSSGPHAFRQTRVYTSSRFAEEL